MTFLPRLERLLFICGLLLLATYVAVRIHGTISTRAELRRFGGRVARSTDSPSDFQRWKQSKPDFSLWSSKRIEEFERSTGIGVDSPVAVLRISKVHLEVPVFSGTDDLILNIGVGHIAGTVGPGEEGNIGIAGHRDGFFRGLKDIGPGDAIELQGPKRTDTYVVDRIVIVSPDDVSVLQPRQQPSLTLVTCYPFYFIGSAPQRYIVQASITNFDPKNFPVSKEWTSGSTNSKDTESTR